jgi:hypothetical protein
MSRTGWTDGDDSDNANWHAIMTAGAIKSAIRGKRGQAFLRDLAEALDAMPDKRLADGLLIAEDGCKCALGVLGERRGLDLLALQPEEVGMEPLDWDQEAIAKAFGVAESLTNQVQWINDGKCAWGVDADKDKKLRWQAVRDWVARNLETDSARPRERAA